MKKKFFSKLLMVALVATVGAFSSCKDYDDDIADVRNSLTQKATELQKDYNDKIAAVNTTLEKLQTSYDNLEAAYKKADEALKAQLETTIGDKLAEAKAYTDAAKGEALTAAKAAEEAANTYAQQQAAAAQAAAIAAAKEQVAAAQKELSDKLAAANELIASQGKSIENLLKVDQTLEAAIATAQARANEAYALADKANTLAETNKANLEKAASEIAALQTSLSALESKAADKADVAKFQSDLAALQKTVNENVVNLADYKENITKLTSDLATLKEDLAKQVSILGESIAAVKATAEGNVAKIESINTQLAKLQEANTQAHEQIIASVNSLAQTVEANKGEAATALTKAVEGIEAKLAATNKLIETNDAAIRALVDTKASELKALIDGNTAAIVKNAQDIQKNAETQKAENTLMNNAIAKNAQDIVAQGKDITKLDDAVKALKAALGDDTAATLKAYAESVAKSEALQAKLDAQGYADAQDAAQKLTIMDAIKQQAAQDKEAWESAIKIAIENLVTTYKLASLNEYIKQTAEAAQTAAETNAAAKAQEIANDALQKAKAYTDVLAQTLKDNYTTTTDMQTAIENAKKAAVSQAYLDVLNTLLRDYDAWYSMNNENKMNLELTPTIIELTKAAVEKYGLTKENAQSIIDATIEAGLTKPEGTGTYDKDGKEIMTEPGVIMAEILAAADALQKEFTEKFNGIDLRLKPIEQFLGATLGEGEAFKASVNAIIATSATASDVEALKKQLAGTEASGLLTKIDDATAQAKQNAVDVKKVMTTINNINQMFSDLFGGAEATSNVDQTALDKFEGNIKSLVERINGIKAITDNLDEKVMESVNKNLGPQIQTMITSINLFANQHMADLDEKGKIAYWNGDEWEYPNGYNDFDHILNFTYTIERGILSKIGEPIKDDNKEWNYPEGLLNQLKGIKSPRDLKYSADMDYTYSGVILKEDKVDAEGTQGFDFVDGRYRSYEDKVLVRVSPVNADLTKADFALLNSKGEDLIANGLIEVQDVYPYEDDAPIVRFYNKDPNTRAQEAEEIATKSTGLWVIEFKMKDENVATKYAQFAQYKGSDILYAVAVKNTNFSADEETTDDGIERYVVSEYDLSLATTEAKHSWDFDVNKISVAKIHNRYITPDESENGTTNYTDDPLTPKFKNGFRYELTWHELCAEEKEEDVEDEDEIIAKLKNPWYYYCFDCCFDDYGRHLDECYETKDNKQVWKGHNEIGYTGIIFDAAKDNYDEKNFCGVNTCDRHDHVIKTTEGIEGTREMTGIDNRHALPKLPIEFTEEQAPEEFKGDGSKWAKIEIEFPSENKCGEKTPIRGFFVTLDQHFAVESNNSEINAWNTYEYKNVAKYNYNHGVKQTGDLLKEDKIVLQKGNKGVIYIKDEHNINNGDVIGFRVHAVNLDGTFTDPDGRAFYVEIGKKEVNHKLSFHITPEDYETEAFAVQDLVNGKNPIVKFNDDMAKASIPVTFFNRDLYGEDTDDADYQYNVYYTWRGKNPAIRTAYPNGVRAYYPVAGTGKGVYNEGLKQTGTFVTSPDENGPAQYAKFDVEDFFDFNFSVNGKATIENNKDNDWVAFNAISKNGYYAPSAETQSVRASIKPEVADRLLDNATYTITMTIKRKDVRTTEVVTNTVDIDITKAMPTGVPSAFKMKTGQEDVIKKGVWTVYVRPLSDNEYAGRSGSAATVAQTWQINWTNFKNAKDPAKGEFATDRKYDSDLKTWAALDNNISHKHGRWAADVRPWTIDEMFEGIIIENVKEGGSVEKKVDENYYFVFEGAGDLVGARTKLKAEGKPRKALEAPKDNSMSIEAVADNEYKDKNGITMFSKAQSSINPGSTTGTLSEAGYRIAPAHYSHVYENSKSAEAETFNVKAGYVYKRISAQLDKTGKKFLTPQANAEIPEAITKENGSLSISNYLNQDYIVAPRQIKTPSEFDPEGKEYDLKTKYICALDKAVSLPTAATLTASQNGNTVTNGILQIPYAKGDAIDIFTAAKDTKISSRDKKFFADGGTNQAYFDAAFGQWTDDTKLSALIDQDKVYWIDYSSLKINLPSSPAYTLSEYYDYFFAATANAEKKDEIKADDPKKNKDIKYVVLTPKYRDQHLPALSKDYTGITVSFDVYDKWYHKATTITVSGATILKPENQPVQGGSRQSR